MTIDKINTLLMEASEKQHELSDRALIVELKIEAMQRDLLHLKALKKDFDTVKNAPRDKAKELALEYVLSGQDINQLPRALKVRYRKSYSYLTHELIGWLSDNGYQSALKIDAKNLKKLLDTIGTSGTPATEIETAEIACDVDLKWMAES